MSNESRARDTVEPLSHLVLHAASPYCHFMIRGHKGYIADRLQPGIVCLNAMGMCVWVGLYTQTCPLNLCLHKDLYSFPTFLDTILAGKASENESKIKFGWQCNLVQTMGYN